MMNYDKITRLLHWGIAVGIPLQLISEMLMKRPKPGRIRAEDQIFFFEMHEWVGMIVLSLIVMRLIWGVIGMGDGRLSKLFPYATTTGRQGIMHELRTKVPGWLRGKFEVPEKEDYIAGTVHGLGVLLVLALGATGAVMLYGMEESGKMLGFVHEMKEVHEILGTVLWVYIVGHVVMALVHQLAGHKSLQRIFTFKGQ